MTEIRLLDEYQSGLRAGLQPVSKRLRVVVDCGNGTAGPVAIPLYEALGCEVVPLFAEPDGSFPNHHPDPTVAENLRHLSREVCRRGADLGLAFGDVKCSGRLFSDVKERGGRAIMWKSGHSLIKAKAREESALLAGEWSGHFCFADRFFGFDDGIYAGGRLIEVCGRGSVPCSGLLEDLAPVCSVPEIRLDCPDPVKFAVMDRLIAHFSDRYDTITLDGVRIVTDDAWALIRASNTQPVLVLRFEAGSAERLEALRTSVEEKVLETIKASLSGDSQCSTS